MKINLSLLFKIGALFVLPWALGFFFAPEMMAEQNGIEYTTDIGIISRGQAIAFAAIATYHWVISLWGGNNMSKFALITSFLWLLFGCVFTYDIYNGNVADAPQNIFGTGANFVFAILFFLGSRNSN